MELFLIYLWLKLDLFIIVLGAVGAWGVLSPIAYAISKSGKILDRQEEEYAKQYWPIYRKLFFIGVFLCALSTLLPSAKDTAILIGASYGLDLAKSPEGAKALKLIRGKTNEFLDEQLKEIGKQLPKP